jgi:hypothetical protein
MHMALVDRVKNIILKPQDEWPVIAAEPATTSGLYTSYVAPLAAIPAVASFIGMTLIGYSMLGISIKLGFGQGLTQMTISFALALATTYVLALIIEALAPTFEGQKDRMAALKLSAYSSTPGWVAGIFQIIPSLGLLVILASLYGIYLLYIGLPVLMKCPKDKAPVYTAAIVGSAVVLAIIAGAVIGSLSAGPSVRM